MNIDEYTKIKHKKASLRQSSISDEKIKYIKNLITRSLLSIILIISTSIFIKINSDNALLVSEYVFKDSLKFTKINNWYQDNLGKILPNTKENTNLVFNSNDIKTGNYSDYLNGVKIDVPKSSPVSILIGGIVVFIGEQEGYGNTIIIQGNDGVDYWYGGISNVNIGLYDYLEKDTLIGEAKENYIYLVLEKDSEYLNYEEYIIKS